jgi:hypothetical protein
MNPLLVGMLSATLPLGQSIGVFAVVAYGLLIVAALLLPETNGRLLTAEELADRGRSSRPLLCCCGSTQPSRRPVKCP